MAYVIQQTRQYYGPRERKSLLVDWDSPIGEPLRFPTRAAAQQYLDALAEEIYRLDYNEVTRPTYRIREQKGEK